MTLFEALKRIYPDSSNITIRNFLKNKRVYVDNILIVNPKEIIEKDKTISVYPIIKKIPYGIEVIFEDKGYISSKQARGFIECSFG